MPWQVPNMQELHQRLRDVIAGHCASWPGVTTLQKARGLAATPYPLCNMLLGIHLRAPLPAATPRDELNVTLTSLNDP